MRKASVVIPFVFISIFTLGGCSSDEEGVSGTGGVTEDKVNLTFDAMQWGHTLIVEQGQDVSLMRSIEYTEGGGGGDMVAAPVMPQDSGPFRIAYYFSSDDALDTETDSLMSPIEEIGGIDSGWRTQLDHFVVHVPADFPTGTYNAIGVLDFDDEIEESDETDNIDMTYSAFKLEVVAPASRRPDLYAPSSAHHSQIDQGTSDSLTVEVGNAGAVSSGASSTCRLYLSQDYDLDPGDELLTPSDIVIPALAAGEGFEVKIIFTVPSSISGSAFFVLDIDAGDDIAESVEVNNEYHMTTTVNP